MKYVSGRLKELKIGITSYSEDKTPLEVVGSVSVGGSLTVNNNLTVNNIAITSTTSTSEFANLSVTGVSTFGGNVAIGTDDVDAVVSAANTTKLAVGILTANRIFSTVFGQFTGGSVLADSIVGTGLSISGISTFGGNVAIGTDDATKVVGAGNTSILAVGILTANRIFSTVFGQFTGGSVLADNIVGTGLSISGISTLGTVQISSGIITASSGVVTYFGDGSNLTGTGNTTNVRTDSLVVSGVSTFNDLVDINAELNTQGGRIVGAATSNVIPFLYANYSDLPSPVTYHGAFAHVHATGKAYYAHAGAWFELVNKEADGRVGTGTEGYNVGHIDATSLNISGLSTFSGLADFNNRIVGLATNNVIPFLYSNYSDLPSAVTYHGAFAHVHATGKAYYAHAANWFEIVNKESDGRVGTGTEGYNVGHIDATSLDVSGKVTTTGFGVTVTGQLYVSNSGTFGSIVSNGNINANGNIIGDNSSSLSGFSGVSATVLTGTLSTAAQPNITNLGILDELSVSGVTTFAGNINANGNIVGDNATNISGINSVTATKFFGDGSGLENVGVDTGAVNTDSLQVAGVSTFTGNINANGNIIGDNATNISGINSVTATSFHGDGSELENLNVPGISTSTVSSFNNLNVAGVSTFGGNIDANGQLDVDGLSSLDDVVATGFVTFSNTLKVGSSLDVDGAADIAGHLELGSSVNIAGVTTIAGDITVGGNITGDGSTVISGVTSVIATKFFGNGEGITGITADSLGDLDHLKVTGLSTFVGNSQFDGNVSIAGTLTYEDVTNVDSIGVITARSGIVVGAGISAVGIVTASGFVGSGNSLTALNANNLSSGIVPDARFPATLPTASGVNLTSLNASQLSSGTIPDGRFPATLPAISGANLTNVTAVFATKAGIATYTSSWVVTANGASHYRFAGPGNLSTQDDPTIYLVRGQQYEFDLNVSGHPFLIRVSNGGSQYTDGVTTVGNNQTGKIRFDVPMDAPSELFYQCQYHSGMFGKFEITDGSKIVQGNSKVEVVDTGSNGHVKVETEGTERLRINSSGHVVPGTDSQYDIGTNTVRFANIYGDVLYGDGSNLTGITAAGTGAIGGLTIKSETGAVVGTAGSVATIDFNNSTGVTVTASSGASGIASVVIAGVGTDTSVNTTGIITAIFSGDGQDLDNVSFGSTDGNFIGKGYLQAQKTVNAGGSRGQANIILGRFAGCCHDGSSYNIYLGDQAGRKSSSGSTNRNVFIGCQAGCGNTTGYHNVFLGSETGKGVCGDSGSMNLFAGLQAGIRNTGCYNIAFGKAAYGRETGTKNIAIGHGAATDVGAGGTSNVFIGEYAGNNAQVNGPPCRGGISNVYVGTHAGYQNPGDFNIGIGDNSLNGNSSVTAGCRNIALGQCSGNDIQSGVDNIMLGSCAGAKITTGGCNILLGYNAGCNAAGSFRNVYVGTNIGKTVCGGAYDISLGSENLCDSKWACNNIAIGKNIFTKANCQGPSADALFNIGIGDAVGTGLTTGGYNIMLGYLTGYCLTCGSRNIILGCRAGWKANESTSNIFIGCYAGRSTVSAGCAGQANIAIGNLAGSQTSSTSDRNIFIGNRAGVEATGGCFNIALGADAATYLTGDRNIFIGQYSGFSQNISGDKNVVIGDAVCLLSATGSSQLVIGAGATHWIDGDSSFNVTLAGIATVTKATGVVEATKFCGDGSCLTNLPSSGLEVDACINVITQNTCSGCNLDGTNATHQARDNVFIGCCAAASATYAHNSIMIGACAGQNVTTGGYNIFFGDRAGCTVTTGSKNLFIGMMAGAEVCGSSYENVFIGHQAARSAQASNRNVAIGVNIMTQGGLVGNYNVLFGRDLVNANVCRTTGFTENIIGGSYAAYNAASSGCNVILGARAGYSITSGGSNIIFGKCAVYSGTFTGSYNFVAGCHAACKISSGNCNVFIGKGVGRGVTTSGNNVFLGVDVANGDAGDVTGSNNIAFGYHASKKITTGADNITIGRSAGCELRESLENVFIGLYAGSKVQGFSNRGNNYIGRQAGQNMQCGSYNTAFGDIALRGSGTSTDNTGDRNIAIGACTGLLITTGSHNIFLGDSAGCSSTSGKCNIFVGRSAGITNTTGQRNIAIGCCVQLPSTICNDQLAIGRGTNRWIAGDSSYNVTLAGIATVTASTGVVEATKFCGDGSCLTGIDAGLSADAQGNLFANNTCSGCNFCGTNAENNILLGCCTGKAITCGDNNIFMGKYSGDEVNIGSCNIGLGWKAGSGLTTACCNVYIGACAGANNTAGNLNTAIGPNAALQRTGGTANVFIGRSAGTNNGGQTGNCNIGIGFVTLGGANSDADFNIAIGQRAGKSATSGGCNIFLGLCSAENLTTGADNIVLGRCAMQAGTVTGNHNITFGYQAGLNVSSGNCNVLIGRDAGKCVTAGVNNVFIGTAAGNQTSTDTNYGNVGLGFISLQSLTTGGCNFAANGYSGCSITTGSHNITIGEKAGRSIDTGNGNIFLGQETGCNSTGSTGCNIFIGHNAGKNATTTASNIAIGFKVELPSATANCQLAIGVCNNNWIVGNSDFNVGIGTTNPKTDFQVGSHYGVVGGGGTFTAAAGVAHTINEYTIASTDFKTAEYTIFANTGSKIQSQKLLVMQDGTTAYSQEYAVMSSDTQLVSAGANITSGVVKIELTPESGVSGLTTFRFTRHTML